MAREPSKTKSCKKLSSSSKKCVKNKQVSNILHYKKSKSTCDAVAIANIGDEPSSEENWKTYRLNEIKEEPSESNNTCTEKTAKFDDETSSPTSETEVSVVNYNTSDIHQQNRNISIANADTEMKTIPQYSPSFFLDQNVQEKLFQQNLLAQQLLVKYFGTEQQTKPGGPDDVRTQALEILHTVSSLLRKYHSCEEAEQVGIGPSERFIIPKDVTIRSKASSLRILSPYRYQTYVQDSMAHLHLALPLEPINFKSRFFYEDSLVRDRSSEHLRFLNVKCSQGGQLNKILYKNDSRNLEKDFSCDDFQASNFPVITETYLSLRNLYSRSYLDRPSLKSTSMFGVRFNSNLDFKISDEEYKLWLKQNNFTRYSKLSVTTDTTPDSACEDLMHLSVSQTIGLPNQSKPREKVVGFCEKNAVSRDPHYSSFHQMIICEHIVISNFIYFFSYYFFAKRLKKLTMCDRIGQLVFFIMSYYVIVLLNKSGIQDIGNTLNFRDLFQ